jgi:hypothetical protein
MLGRDGNISIIRVGTLAAIAGVLLILGAIVFFFIDRASHQVPLDIEPYPGAISGGQIGRSSTSRTALFNVPNASPEEVVAYYQDKMNSFYGSDTEAEFRQCKRFPSTGEQPEYTRGVAGVVPYQYTCLFDRSGFFVTQSTAVVIQPGIGDREGTTVVAYEQIWQS